MAALFVPVLAAGALMASACTGMIGDRAGENPAGGVRGGASRTGGTAGAGYLSPEEQEILLAFWEEQADYGLALFRIESYRDRVVEFYARETGSDRIAGLILKYADENDIPLALAFSLAWAESGYNVRAVNRNSSSVDRGLFQLNDRSFPDLAEEEFFDPEKNARLGLGYLRQCLNAGETEIVALAMYNAGRARVSGRGTPLMTLEYISRILEHRENLEVRFSAFCLKGKGEKTAVVNRIQPRVVDRKKGIK